MIDERTYYFLESEEKVDGVVEIVAGQLWWLLQGDKWCNLQSEI